jgi:hypothetical protein
MSATIMSRPLVHLVAGTWVITYTSSDDGRVHDNDQSDSMATAMRRALHVAIRQGRAG